jgi:hypothetical protein
LSFSPLLVVERPIKVISPCSQVILHFKTQSGLLILAGAISHHSSSVVHRYVLGPARGSSVLLIFPIFVEIPGGCVEFNRGVVLNNKNAAWMQRNDPGRFNLFLTLPLLQSPT